MSAAAAPVPAREPLPWARVALVLLVIAGAHAALYLLLTAGARRDIAAAEARYDRQALEAAVRPGPAPSDPSALAGWHRRQALYEAREAWVERRQLDRVLGGALLASFLLQTGVTGWMLARAGARQRTRPRG